MAVFHRSVTFIYSPEVYDTVLSNEWHQFSRGHILIAST